MRSPKRPHGSWEAFRYLGAAGTGGMIRKVGFLRRVTDAMYHVRGCAVGPPGSDGVHSPSRLPTPMNDNQVLRSAKTPSVIVTGQRGGCLSNRLICRRKSHAVNRNSGESDIDGCGGMQHAMQRVYSVRGQRIAASCLSGLRFRLPMGARHRQTLSFRYWRVRRGRRLPSVADCTCPPGRLPTLRARRHGRVPAGVGRMRRPSSR